MNLLITWWSSLLFVFSSCCSVFFLSFILFILFSLRLCFARFLVAIIFLWLYYKFGDDLPVFFSSPLRAFHIPLNMKLFKFFQLVSTIFDWILNWIFIRAVFLCACWALFLVVVVRFSSASLCANWGAYCFLLFMRSGFFPIVFRTKIIFTCWHGCVQLNA